MEFGPPPEELSDDEDSIQQRCGPGDERMSWGLQFYEQQDQINKAHFPDVFPKTDRLNKNGQEVEQPEVKVKNPLALNIEIPSDRSEKPDWKYKPPNQLSQKQQPVDGNEQYDEEYDEEDDPFQQANDRDIFYEQRML